jgi:hypothetical protein
MKTITFWWHCTEIFNDWHDSFKYPVDFPASIPSNVTENIKILIKVRFMIPVYEKLNRFDLFTINVFKIHSKTVLH